jgi:hypothetical protein
MQKNRKVAGSSPDEVIDFLFPLPNPSSRTIFLNLIQHLTEMITRKHICEWSAPARKANHTTINQAAV